MGDGCIWPQLRRLQVSIRGRSWHVVLSDDLAEALLDPNDLSSLSGAALAAVDAALVVSGAGAWRLCLDVNGLLVGMAVDVRGAMLRLGSPKFAAERFLVAALSGRQSESESAWRAHVHGWRSAQAQRAPLDVARSTALLGFADLLDPSAPAADPNGPLRVGTPPAS